MSEHSVQEAERDLAGLIDRVLAGEGVVITRDGHPVASLTPIRAAGRPLTGADLDWLATQRLGTPEPGEDAGRVVSRLRDEDW